MFVYVFPTYRLSNTSSNCWTSVKLLKLITNIQYTYWKWYNCFTTLLSMTILKGEALFTLNAITFVLLINMLKSPFAVSLLTVILIVAKHPTSLAISDAHLHLVTFLGQNVRSQMTSVYNSRLQFIAQSKSSFNFPLGNIIPPVVAC